MLEQYLHPLTHLISKLLYEMETLPFYGLVNQTGKGGSQKQRSNFLPVSSESSEDPVFPPAKGPVGCSSGSVCVFGVGIHEVAGTQSLLCPLAFAG